MSDKASKTEKPSPKKLADARKKGQTPKSREVVAWGSLLVSLTLLKGAFNRGSSRLTLLLAHMGDDITHPSSKTALAFMREGLNAAFAIVVPLIIGLACVAIVGDLSQTGFVLATGKLKPKLSNLNPIPGLKRLVSGQSMWEGVKTVIKMAVLLGISWTVLRKVVLSMALQGPMSVFSIAGYTVRSAMSYVRIVALIGLLIAAIDYGMTRKRTRKSLMMTKEEVKQEFKNQEGDGQVKGQIRNKGRQMSRNRMMTKIAEADVVLVNPTHIAVALKYIPGGGAPKVVAKGMGELATRIRDKAEENSVPIVKDIPLARAIHKSCEIDDEISAELFEGVARVLAFIFALKRRPTVSRGGVLELPQLSAR